MTFLQGGTEGTAGAAELGALGRAEGQCPVQDQDVCNEMSCPCTWDTLWTHRDAEEVLLQESAGSEQLDQLPRQTPVGDVTPQNPVGAERSAGFWSGKEQVELARCTVHVCSSFVLTTGTQGTQAKPWPDYPNMLRKSKHIFFCTVIILLIDSFIVGKNRRLANRGKQINASGWLRSHLYTSSWDTNLHPVLSHQCLREILNVQNLEANSWELKMPLCLKCLRCPQGPRRAGGVSTVSFTD